MIVDYPARKEIFTMLKEGRCSAGLYSLLLELSNSNETHKSNASKRNTANQYHPVWIQFSMLGQVKARLTNWRSSYALYKVRCLQIAGEVKLGGLKWEKSILPVRRSNVFKSLNGIDSVIYSFHWSWKSLIGSKYPTLLWNLGRFQKEIDINAWNPFSTKW